jgi:ABC-2 type transport system permease protein
MSAVPVPAVRRLYWSVRRELWEYRSVYLGPLIVGAVVLIGFSIALVHLPGRVRAASALGDAQLRQVIEGPYVLAALMLMFIEILVAAFYCLDALHGERRDRSILFWKSLPISDLTTVLAKASIPILVLPLVTFGVTVATQTIMLLASSAVLAGNGLSASMVWTYVPLGETSWINLTHLVVIHGLWYAPAYAWLLLTSAWATRAPILWAALPPAAIGILEKLAFNSTHFAELVRNHFVGIPASAEGTGEMTMAILGPSPIGSLLASPELWGGLLLTAVFLFGAVRLRRAGGPM